MRLANEGFIPIIKDADGFLAYYAVNAGAGEIATVSVFEDQAGADRIHKVGCRLDKAKPRCITAESSGENRRRS
jgi:hypothetical protein